MFGRGTQAELLAYFFDRDTSPGFKTPARCLHSGDESRIVLKSRTKDFD
jgi:hypothetical protein